MSLEIPANDFGQIRVFQTHQTLATETTPETLAALFGTDALDPRYVDIIKIEDLTSMLLSDYIMQGYALTPDEHDIPALDGIEGYAVLVLSSAAQGQAVTLTPADHLHHITTVLPEAQLEVITPLQSDAASGIINDPPAKPAKSDARIGGMVATIALLVMFLLVGLMIWIA